MGVWSRAWGLELVFGEFLNMWKCDFPEVLSSLRSGWGWDGGMWGEGKKRRRGNCVWYIKQRKKQKKSMWSLGVFMLGSSGRTWFVFVCLPNWSHRIYYIYLLHIITANVHSTYSLHIFIETNPTVRSLHGNTGRTLGQFSQLLIFYSCFISNPFNGLFWS